MPATLLPLLPLLLLLLLLLPGVLPAGWGAESRGGGGGGSAGGRHNDGGGGCGARQDHRGLQEEADPTVPVSVCTT